MTVTVPSGRRTRTKLIWLVPAVGFMIVLAPVVLLAGAGNPPCTSIASSPTGLPVGSGPWIATAYGPPWDAINGSGVTATGLNLTAGQPAYEIAVDPSVIPLRSFAHVSPNPFGPHTPSTPAIRAGRSSDATSTSTTGKAAPPRTRGASATSP